MSYSCKEIQQMLNGYLDGMLDPKRAEAVQMHIQSCKACAKELDELRHISQLLKAADIAPLPFDFQEQLHNRLLQEQQKVVPFPLKKRRFSKYRIASAVAAGFLVVFAVGSQLYMQFSPSKYLVATPIAITNSPAQDTNSDDLALPSSNPGEIPSPTQDVTNQSDSTYTKEEQIEQKKAYAHPSPSSATQPTPGPSNEATPANDLNDQRTIQNSCATAVPSPSQTPTASPESNMPEEYFDANATNDIKSIGASTDIIADVQQQEWTKYIIVAEEPDKLYQILKSQYPFAQTDQGYQIEADRAQTDALLNSIRSQFEVEIKSEPLDDSNCNVILITSK